VEPDDGTHSADDTDHADATTATAPTAPTSHTAHTDPDGTSRDDGAAVESQA
jgi:hypothetical protein